MSTMEEIIAAQEQLKQGIHQVYSNFKKDSSERKTTDYLRRRLDKLDQYWREFNSNHVKLLSFGDKSHSYFSGEYDQLQESFTFIKNKIQHYQPIERPETPILKPPTFVPGPSQGPNPPSEKQVPERVSTMTVSKTEEMLKKQSSNFKAFMRTASNINIDTVTEKWELEDLLHTLQARWSVIDKLHWELDSELDGSHQDYEHQFSNYESHYNTIKKTINKKMWSVAHREKSTPTMEIPTFNGSYTQWIPFKDLFSETVHNNPSLSNAQKMQFLRGKVKGDAEKLIQHLQISSDNYLVCWEILNHRYNNKRQIFMSHANTIMNIPVMQNQAVNNIKRIHDTTKECLNAIKNLGVDISTWDPLLVFLLSQKLDTDTYHDYMESMKQPRELPKLDEFLEFLENKFTTLESSRRKQDNATQKQGFNSQGQSSKHQNQNYYKHSFTSSARVKTQTYNKKDNFTRFSCPICNNNDHGIYYCQKFIEMPPSIKLENVSRLSLCQNCLFSHKGKSCFSPKKCRECNKEHNTLLHNALKSGNPKPEANQDWQSSTPPNTHQMKSSAHVSQSNPSEILLATAIIKVQAADGSTHLMRALLDQGSQTSLITENAAQILRLPRQRCLGVITGIGAKESSCKGMMKIKCFSTVSDFTFDSDTFIIKNLIKNLPSASFSKPDWSYLYHIKLADPEFYKSRPVDILLGADIYSTILMEGICRVDQSLPTAQQTQLGWILSGNVRTFHCNVIMNNMEQIQRFWEIEDIAESSNLSSEDQECMEIYRSTTTRREDGRYEVSLPLKPNYQEKLGDSKSKSIAQFFQLERKLQNNADVAKEYKTFINEYLSLGHMTPAASNNNSKPEFYLPHHCVIRQESTTTKLRVVFNGSARTSTGFSLNDVMCKGPNLQQDLQNLIIKWRQYRYALTADIEKMFRQIWINSDHQSLQKIIWRDNQSQLLQEYLLTTITYGTKAAPFLAMMTLKRLAQDERANYPDSPAPEVLEESFYMDDLLHGAHSAAAAKQLIHDIKGLLKSGGFNLRKWKSNLPELLHEEGECELEKQDHFDFKQAESTKTLGLKWDPKEDKFIFQSVTFSSASKATKRSLLSDIAKVYDPLGWLAPFTTKLKIIFQDVWKAGIEWDDPVPHSIQLQWDKIKQDIKIIDEFHIPRWLNTQEDDTIELHGFCDASTKAYACVIYCKVIKQNETVVTLVAGKAKLVPVNKVPSLPRLELSGALLLSKLITKIKNCLPRYNIKIYGWTDSMVVLGWLNGEASKWKPFVANRVSQIVTSMPPQNWQYIKSGDNPADCASRGITVPQLQEHSLWWQGPAWLPEYAPTESEKQNYFTNQEAKLSKQVAVIQASYDDGIIKELLIKNSSLNKVIRVLAWVLRFIKRKDKKVYLTIEELKQSRNFIIKQVQHHAFLTEIQKLKEGKAVNAKSSIISLNPVLDQDELLRVGGRLRHANLDPEIKHPIIIPNNTRLADLIIDQSHELTFHGGAKLTTAFTRQKYWLLGGNRATKKRLRNCVTCRRHNPSQHHHLMGDLPPARITPSRPFYHTGVDYTGHVAIKANKGRGIKTTKGYVAVFVCMATKAVHLELVCDLTTSSFLAALHRMTLKGGPRSYL